MTQLAERAGVTAAAITQMEKGDIRPSPDTLGRISMTLGFLPQYFSADVPGTLSEDRCHFRRARTATKKEQRRVLAKGSLLLSLAAHLDSYIHFPPSRIRELSSAVSSPEDLEALARDVRDTVGVGRAPIADMVSVLEALGVFVLEVLAGSPRMDAFSTWWKERPIVFLGGDKGSGSRRRFDAAHELGHLLMHEDVRPGDKEHESQADRFASAFLMPAETFAREVPERLSLPRLLELKMRWKVSVAAMIRRAYDLGIYSEATYRRGYMQLGRFGWRDGEPNEPEMEHGSMLRNAHRMVSEKVGGHRLAEDLGLREREVEELLAGSTVAPTLALF